MPFVTRAARTGLCCLGLVWLGSGLGSAQATTALPALSSELSSVPSAADIDKAAQRVAEELDGVLRNCPASYAAVGTPDKRCVGVSGDVETLRTQLGAALGEDLYGVWRSRDDQHTVFNWIKMPSGAVYLRIASDDTAGRSLIYLDAPTVPASAMNTPQTPPAGQPATSKPNSAQPSSTKPNSAAPSNSPGSGSTFQAASPSASGVAASPGGVTITRPPSAKPAPPFKRVLALKTARLSGADVLAAQNRLISLTIGHSSGKGDGWYGPNTAKAVHDFQVANGLSATGVLDKITWDALFSANAKMFKAASR